MFPWELHFPDHIGDNNAPVRWRHSSGSHFLSVQVCETLNFFLKILLRQAKRAIYYAFSRIYFL